jgi:hypothetical protein
MRAGYVLCQIGRYGPPASLSSGVSCMKTFITLILSLALQAAAYSADVTDTNASEEAQYEQLYQRFLTRMREVQSNTPSSSISFTNNLDTPQAREAFRRMFVVHPSFGLGWSEVPPPTVTSSNAMKGASVLTIDTCRPLMLPRGNGARPCVNSEDPFMTRPPSKARKRASQTTRRPACARSG